MEELVESETETETEESESESRSTRRMMMRCISCKEEYSVVDAGTCKECYEEASETEEELKREIDELKSKVSFLRLFSPLDPHASGTINSRFAVGGGNGSVGGGGFFTDVVLLATSDGGSPVPVPAHKAVLVSRSSVFKAMLENEMEESRSSTIKISDISYDTLRTFINYLYTAEARLDERLACNLLELAEKYEVKHLKEYCEKFLLSKLSWDNSLMGYAFAHQQNAQLMRDAALSLITDNMDKVTKGEEYKELVEKDPRLVVEIYEAYLSKQVNTAAHKDSPMKP